MTHWLWTYLAAGGIRLRAFPQRNDWAIMSEVLGTSRSDQKDSCLRDYQPMNSGFSGARFVTELPVMHYLPSDWLAQ